MHARPTLTLGALLLASPGCATDKGEQAPIAEAQQPETLASRAAFDTGSPPPESSVDTGSHAPESPADTGAETPAKAAWTACEAEDWPGYSCPPCEPDCSDVDCGPDGCGGLCSVPRPYMVCSHGQWMHLCMPNCVGRRCGPDGCGGQCGFCPTGWSCGPTGACESEDGGCGGIPATGECVSGTAWSCADGVPEREHCAYGACALDPAAGAARCAEVPCLPSCFGRTCGDDGCGGSCGTCPDGETCHPEHELCVPAEGCGPIDEAGTCLAHTLVSCEANELTFEPCLSRGQVCSTDPCDGRPTCHNVWPHTPCCDVPAGGHCAGKHLFTCDGEGWLSIRHCVDDFHRVCIRRDLERHDCFIR